jgi:23S rRNA pseudouridine2605 synthase
VTVNGVSVTQPGTKVDPSSDTVAIDGSILQTSGKKIYIMLHKPEGAVTTVSDPQGRPTVMDYLPQEKIKEETGRVFPVGRLDYDTSGLLILTNDGDLAYKMTHPRHMIKKTYIAKLRGIPSGEAILNFRRGLNVDGMMTAPCGFNILGIENKKNEPGTRDGKRSPHANEITNVKITIREGRNRQIRKMCELIGCPVLSLKRVAIGPLRLGSLPRGGYRFLTDDEIEALNECCEG